MGKAAVKLIMILCTAAVFSVGCATVKVDRVDVDQTIDLSGKWNDTDSRLVSEEMIADVLNRAWLGTYRSAHRRNPVVIVGTVRNRSDEHINTRTFVKDLEKALINSGEVAFVASADERGELRDERKDQASHASDATAKEEGQEIGADFMLQGSINTISDRLEGKEVRYYQINLELIDVENNRKAWIGDKKIKKLVQRSRLGL
jgi:penicillin-binding protein activator